MSKLTRRRFISITAVSAGLAVTGKPAAIAEVKPCDWQGRVLGADASIRFYESGDTDNSALEAALAEITKYERQLSIYDPSSAVSRLNETGYLKFESSLNDGLFELVERAKAVRHDTGGLFDPTIQPLFRALAGAEGRPSTQEWSEASQLVGLEKVITSDGDVLRYAMPGMAMTFNGIAQGYITDKVRQVLNRYGFTKSLINIGEYSAGDRVARIGVAGADDEIFAIAELQNQAIATSSPGSYRFPDGSSHILHPDGTRQKAYWETVSVVASDATLADGYSTALSLTQDSSLVEKLIRDKVIQKAFLRSKEGVVYRL